MILKGYADIVSEKDIKKSAILHIMDSAYCFPVSENEIVLRLRTAKNDIIKAEVIYESKYIIGERQQKAVMKKILSDDKFDFFSVKLHLEDTRLAYVFYLEDADGKYYFSEDGVTKDYDFKLGYYNFFQYPFINSADIHRSVKWMENAVFYQIFVDRFNIGRKDKDMSYVNIKWGDIPEPKSFAGGDIKGITDKLDYLLELGINTIYLTPVFTSISNHKYDISDYKNVDSQFGSNEDLRELIEEAHKRNIRIILDAVFNHCSENLEQFKDVVMRGYKSPYHDWFFINGDKPNKKHKNYETFAECTYMPKFNTSNPEVQDFLIDIGVFWVKEYNIDGWRLDVSDEVSHDFWRHFRSAVKKENKNLVIIGENWHDASNYLRGDQYDSIMNYAFTKACLDYFSTGKFNAQNLADKLSAILMRNTDTVNNMMLNLLDCHDTDRFLSQVHGNRDKLKSAIALMMVFPGTPCVYYGTEIGLLGGYDPDNRRCMDWEQADKDIKTGDIATHISRMIELRKKYNISQMSTSIYSISDVFVIERSSSEHIIRLFINNTDTKQDVNNVTIDPFSFNITVENC